MFSYQPSRKVKSGLLAATLFSSVIASNLYGQGSILPANGTSEDSPRLGDGYDSVFKVKKFGCVKGKEDSDVNQALNSELDFASNMSLDSIANSLDVNPGFTLNKYFFNLRANTQIINAHSASETSSTFHFFWRGTGKTKSLEHGDSLQPSIPDLSSIAHLETEDGGEVDSLVHLRSACGDEFVSEIRYGAYLIVTLKINFATKEDKKRFESNMQAGMGKPNKPNDGPSTSKTTKMDPEYAQNLSATIGGKLLELDRGHDLRSSSVEVVVNQIGGDPTAMRAILGSRAISGKLITECTGSNDLAKCVDGFSEAVQYTKDFLESLSSGKSNLWAPMVYITRPYISAGSLLQSNLGLLAEDVVLPDSIETKIEQIDLFLDEVKTIEHKASSLLEALEGTEYKVGEDVLTNLKDILQKTKQVHTDVASAVYSPCTKKSAKCEEKIAKFQEKYGFPYTLQIDEGYLDLKLSSGLVKALKPLAGSPQGGQAFDHGVDIVDPSVRTIRKINLKGAIRPSYMVVTLDDESEHIVGRDPGEGFTVGAIDMFGIPVPVGGADISSQTMTFGSDEAVSYVEAHTGEVDGKGRVVYLKICKSDSHYDPMQNCMYVGKPSKDYSMISKYVVDKSERVIGFHGHHGKEIDELGLVVSQKAGLIPSR